MTAKEKTPQEVGKEFELDFQAVLKSLHQRCKANYYRFYDTHSAGAFMPKQPADYFLGFQGAMHFLELKSSLEHQTLSSGLSDLMTKDQAASLRLWYRAGACVHVLFLSQADGAVEWWDGLLVAEARAAGKRIKAPGACIRYADFATFAEDFEIILRANPHFMVKRNSAKEF